MRSWFSKLIKRPPCAEDPDFGKLTYMGGYWEGAGIFPPTRDEVEYFVSAGEDGPSEANRQAFQTICGNYAGLLAKAVSAISSATESTANANELAISSLDVPSGDLGACTWEMNFSGTDGSFFSVQFSGLEATGAVDVSY